MDFSPYLREIDTELALLKNVRRMLMELREPMLMTKSAAPQKAAVAVVVEPVAPVLAEPAAEPMLTVVPPRQKREYHRRSRHAAEVKAIGGTIPQGPVFVKPAVVVAAPAKTAAPAPVEMDAAALEAAIRRKLLGQVA